MRKPPSGCASRGWFAKLEVGNSGQMPSPENAAAAQIPKIIEGGLAETIDLHLSELFAFRKPPVVLSARGNYGLRAKDLGTQRGVFLRRDDSLSAREFAFESSK